jgi:serine/threonine protein phosphatase PrpC/predicted RNA-binding Zn-ribbon protein involved in translation (DUF1610 family)
MPDDDAFCEECGTPLSSAAAVPDCPRCGAGASRIDGDGYCADCGFRRTPHERDHVEIGLSARFAGVSDRGRRHSSNEDYLVLRAGLIVLCDGVSSSQDAALASKAAGDAAADSLEAGRSMKEAIAGAQAAVRRLPVKRGDADAPSTTIVAARISSGIAELGWAGDSRAYWIAPGASRQLTIDDSWINEVVSSGQMSLAEALASKNAHAVTRWLGQDAGNDASFMEFRLPGPGVLLLSSDGLWNYAQQTGEMEELVGTPADALTVARKLVDYAKERGGADNVTAALWIET